MKVINFTPLMTSKQVSFGMAISPEAVEHALKQLNETNAPINEYKKLENLIKKAATNKYADVILNKHTNTNSPFCYRAQGKDCAAAVYQITRKDLEEAVKDAQYLKERVRECTAKIEEDKQKPSMAKRIIRLAQKKWDSGNK